MAMPRVEQEGPGKNASMRFRATHAVAVEAAADEVWAWVTQPLRWQTMWPWVGIDVSHAGRMLVAGGLVRASVPSPLGYRVRFDLQAREVDASTHVLVVDVDGDVAGKGSLRVEPLRRPAHDGAPQTTLHLDWDVEIVRPGLRKAWVLAHAPLTWAHERVVGRAAEDLRAALDGRTTPRPSSADIVAAAAVAGALAGIPSTVHAVLRGRSMWDATRAAGVLLGRPTALRGIAAHSMLSLFWAAVLARRRGVSHPAAFGAVAGVAIAVFDLGVVGRRVAAIRHLPRWPQVADHIAFGALAAAMLARRR